MNKQKIDNIFNKISNDMKNDGRFYKTPVHQNGYKFTYNTYISGINEYYIPYDDIEQPNSRYYHYFSYEFDDIIEQHKRNNNIEQALHHSDVVQLYYTNRDDLTDLSWILVRYDM